MKLQIFCPRTKELKTAVLLSQAVHTSDIISEYRCTCCRTIIITRQEITSCTKKEARSNHPLPTSFREKNFIGTIPSEEELANIRPGIDRFPVDDEHVCHDHA